MIAARACASSSSFWMPPGGFEVRSPPSGLELEELDDPLSWPSFKSVFVEPPSTSAVEGVEEAPAPAPFASFAFEIDRYVTHDCG